MNIADVVEWRAKTYSDKIALVYHDRRISFSEFRDRSNRFVNALYALGMQRGDRVAILSDTCDAYAEVTLCVPKGGMTLVPLNYRFIPEELAYTVNNSDAKTLIISEEFLPAFDAMRPHLKSVRNMIVIGDPLPGMHGYEALIATHASRQQEMQIDENDIAYIIYTSGTTARPKGVMRSHKSLIATAMATAYHHGVRHQDVCFLPNPPFHISFAWPLMTYFCFGCTTIIKRWDPEEALKLISKERISFGVFVPYYIRSMMEFPGFEAYDVSSLRRVSVGSAPMDEDLAKRAVAAFGNIFNFNYGMTEYGSPIAMIHGDDIDLNTPRGLQLLSSVGKGVFNAHVRVVDADGQDVLPGRAGEVIVRGDALMSGYWKLPEETARSMRDGYFYTGDIASVDTDGNLYIVDRAKDMIITGGENVYCPEIESVLMSHPAVLEAAVLGVPDDKWGEAVKGLVILRPGMTVAVHELRTFCRSRLAGYKIPKSIDFYEDFPRTPIGKISKKDLRETYWAGREKRVH